MRQMLVTSLVLATLSGFNTVVAQAPKVTEQVSGTTALLIAVSPVSEKVVWATGQKGTVLRTIDGGSTWENKNPPGAQTLEFRDIHALSATQAWVLSIGNGPKSKIYATNDGGTTWKLQFDNPDSAAFYDCMTMFDAKTGVVFGDTPADGKLRILRTEDGEHWNLLPNDKLPTALKGEGGYASSGGCVVSYGPKHGWIAAGTPESRLFRTEDAGKTWTVHSTPIKSGNATGLAAVSFRDEKNGIAVGSNMNARTTDTTSAAVAITTDGGKTWTLKNRPPIGAIFGGILVPSVSKTTAVIASQTGLMLTRDTGDTWTNLAANNYWSVNSFGKFAWGVGPGGRITRVEF